MPVVTTSAKGQVVIPAVFRKRIGLRGGGKVLVTMTEDNRVLLEPVPDDPIAALRGILKGGPSLTATLLDERRKERERDADQAARLLRRAKLAPGRAGRLTGRAASRQSQGRT